MSKEENVQHFHNPLMEPFPCWRALPVLAQCEILEYLDPFTLNNLRRVANYERYLVEERFGFHVVVPARNWRNLRKEKPVCDSMIQKLLTGMSGKVIRGLEITEMPPFLAELLERCVSFPGCVVQLKLTYFDVELIHRFLTLFQNLKCLEYLTSVYHPVPSALESLIQFQISWIPRANQEFVEFITQGLPAQTSHHLPNLTSLTLCLHQTSDSFDNSDWENVFYLLLAVMPVNLKSFQFSLNDFQLDETVAVIIRCVLAEFFEKTGNLQKISFNWKGNATRDIVDPLHFRGLGFLRVLPVLRPLIERFGSLELQNIFRDMEEFAWFFPTAGIRTAAQNFVGRIASSMRNLKELSLELGTSSMEWEMFRAFIQRVPALENLQLEIPPGLNHSFFGVGSADVLELVATLRKLNYIKVSQVEFPQGRNNPVARKHRNALLEIGTLMDNCFYIE